MNSYSNRNKYAFGNKSAFNHMFIIPPNQYVNFMKRVYTKFKNSNVPKTLRELKRLALEEAKIVSKKIIVGKKGTSASSQNTEQKMEKEDVIKVLKGVFDIINPMFIKINNNFKNERRKVYENDEEYINTIKSFELKKIELIKYILRKTCEMMKISYFTLQKYVLYFIEKNDDDIITLINSFSKVGKSFALAPKHLGESEIIEILKTYYTHFEYFVNSKNKNNVLKYALVLINDIIYSIFGLEEEQIYLKIQEMEYTEKNMEIKKYVSLIQELMLENIFELFEF